MRGLEFKLIEPEEVRGLEFKLIEPEKVRYLGQGTRVKAHRA